MRLQETRNLRLQVGQNPDSREYKGWRREGCVWVGGGEGAGTNRGLGGREQERELEGGGWTGVNRQEAPLLGFTTTQDIQHIVH